jgi:hypothetical protein
MIEIVAYARNEASDRVKPLGTVRDWMDDTWEKHAYHCFPVTLANQYGWGISFPEDISFIWDGISDSSPDHVRVTKGQRYASPGRGNATLSFHTGITLRTDHNINILSMPPANHFIRGAQAFTTIVNSSFLNSELPCAWRITEPNIEITVKAGTPVISIIPVDLQWLQNSEIKFKEYNSMPKTEYNMSDYSSAISNKNQDGKWSDFYRNATDHNGNKIGEHTVKAIRLKVSGISE